MRQVSASPPSDTPAPPPGENAPAPAGTATPRLWRHPEFRRGAVEMFPTTLGIAAWGLITGVAMGKSGLGIEVMVLMSLLVFAGSAQLAVLPLMSSGAPVWVVWATALCVNLRFVIFSAVWRPYVLHLAWHERVRMAYFTADLNTALFVRRFPEPRPDPAQPPYFWGGAVSSWFGWQVPSIAGILLAHLVPAHWDIGFAGVLALLGIALSLTSDRATAVAALVAGCAAVAAYALPLRLNIVVAIAAAVAVGVLIEHTRGGAAALPAPAAGRDAETPP
ncbi:MAG: AzlC family ABC transporter permease [Rubrivivax sp.]|nr:AzlC family ABC transporter permease [Rubrivivax sp.]